MIKLLSPYVPAIISFFLPRIGQITKGDILKGVIFFIIAAVLFILFKVYLNDYAGLIYVYNLYTAYDGYKTPEKEDFLKIDS